MPVAEIIHEAKSALLVRPQEMLSTDFNKNRNCEFSLEMLDTFKLRAINLICNVNKLEIFEGPLKSYRETIYGMVIEKDQEENTDLSEKGKDEVDAVLVTNEDSEDKTIKDLSSTKCYRYDIDASSLGVTALDMRVRQRNDVLIFKLKNLRRIYHKLSDFGIFQFITNQNEICIFGIRIYYSQQHFSLNNHFQNISRSSNFSVDMLNVRKLLEESFRRPSSQQSARSEARLHQFLDAIEKSVEIPYSNSQINNMEHQQKTESNVTEQRSSTVSINEDSIESTKAIDRLRVYLDKRFDDLEKRIAKRIEQLEERQTDKLKRIVECLTPKLSYFPEN